MPEVIFPLDLSADVVKSGTDGNYDAFSSQTVYIRNEGTLQIPLSEGEDGHDNEECIIVKTSQAYGKKIMVWSAAKTGEVPKVPSMAPANDNEVLDFAASGISEPRVIATATSYQVVMSGKYEWWLLKAPSEFTGYTSAKNPATVGDVSAYAGPDRFMPQS